MGATRPTAATAARTTNRSAGRATSLSPTRAPERSDPPGEARHRPSEHEERDGVDDHRREQAVSPQRKVEGEEARPDEEQRRDEPGASRESGVTHHAAESRSPTPSRPRRDAP